MWESLTRTLPQAIKFAQAVAPIAADLRAATENILRTYEARLRDPAFQQAVLEAKETKDGSQVEEMLNNPGDSAAR